MSHVLSTTSNNALNQSGSYTQLSDPELTNIIAHINEEHVDELLGLFKTFTTIPSAEKDKVDVTLTNIYAEGLALQTTPKQQLEQKNSVNKDSKYAEQSNNQVFFIPFLTPIQQLDELQLQYILLRQKADKKLGKKTIKLTKQTFSVQNSYHVSNNMLRLELSLPRNKVSEHDKKQDSEKNALKLTMSQLKVGAKDNGIDNANVSGEINIANPIPTNEAGYAYLFDLEHNFATKQHLKAKIDAPRPHCYYTLRKAWQTPTGTRAWVDVFLHGNTSGGVWASSLQAGDTVISKREFPEKIEHLRKGQALLIADETSMPTIARLLELWDNPTPPLVICITQDAADQTYLTDVKISHPNKDKLTILPLITGKVNSGKALASTIDNLLGEYLTANHLKIEKVWGGLEAATAKTLRGLLKQRLDLERTDIVVKVYWRKDT